MSTEARTPALAGDRGSEKCLADKLDNANCSTPTELFNDRNPNAKIDAHGATPVAHEVSKLPKLRFQLTRFNQIQCGSESRYLVKDIIPREGIVLLWGEPKSSKTFLALDLVLHVALGWHYRGHRVKQGPVIFIGCEGEHGLKARIEAFRKTKLNGSSTTPEFFLLPTGLDLARDCNTLIGDIRSHHVRPVIIVIDTLNRTITGSESSDEDMTKYIRAVDKVRVAFRCAVIVIHHCGHDHGRPRGHSSLLGAVDGQIAVKRDKKTDVITMHVERMKDGREGTKIRSRLETVALEHDTDGELITSCVVREPDSVAGEPEEQHSRTLTPGCRLLLEILQQALTTDGKPAESIPGLPANAGCVISVDALRDLAYSGGISKGASERARQQGFKRSLDGLSDRSLVGETGGFVYLLATNNG